MMHAYLYLKVAVNTQAEPDRNNQSVIFKSYEPFTDCINKINKTYGHDEKDADVVIPM